jgi:nicotinamidase-related amidase
MSYTLAIIDMQPYFTAGLKRRAHDNCAIQIKKAIKDRAAIIFVEYRGYGNTSRSLKSLIRKASYDRQYKVTKTTDNGGKEIAALIKKERLAASRIKVCGVNTDACVHASVLGLRKHLAASKIEVIAAACDSRTMFNNGHQDGLKKMAKLTNVKIK